MNLEGLVLVSKDDDGTSVTQIDRQGLVDHCVKTGVDEATIDVENVLPFYLANANREILEGFFAKVVVLVEGSTESLSLPIYLHQVGLDASKQGIAVIPVHGKGNLAKWRRLFTAYDIPCYVIFDNDGASEDNKGTRRRDALTSVGVTDTDVQEAYIKATDWIIDEQFAVFGSGFEQVLRGLFPKYKTLENEGREAGVDSKPFLARYVAEHLPVDKSSGWEQMKALKDALETLIPN
jgi:putative ATP-dependent endonuclease of the OLD family